MATKKKTNKKLKCNTTITYMLKQAEYNNS